jgi:hypothetical protein
MTSLSTVAAESVGAYKMASGCIRFQKALPRFLNCFPVSAKRLRLRVFALPLQRLATNAHQEQKCGNSNAQNRSERAICSLTNGYVDNERFALMAVAEQNFCQMLYITKYKTFSV